MDRKEFEERLRTAKNDFHQLVPMYTGDRLLPLDFTAANTDLTAEVLADTARFSHYIEEKLRVSGAKYGVGGYAEHRTIYSRSTVFDDDEPRRLHLGLDIWGAAGTPVSAPIMGTVHSFAFNDAFGDYGCTIILSHQLGDLQLHTLYGHLSMRSIEGLSKGMMIQGGEEFAYFGLPDENGHWPPHLHFQIIRDMKGYEGDYPGVCKYSEREEWLENGGDPEVIVQFDNLAI